MRYVVKIFVVVFVGLISACQSTTTLRKTNPEELRAARNIGTEKDFERDKNQDTQINLDIAEPPVKETQDSVVLVEVNLWDLPIVDSIIGFARTQLGTPYKWAGTTPAGFDCSGFVYYVFHHFDIPIPRIPAEIAKSREKLDVSELQAGDFAYFKGRNVNSNRIGHIALVTGKTETGFRMIHASTSQGIVENNYVDYTYWKSRFLFGTRMSKAELLH
ncbi:MAG: C40 family peptidase [Bacteroidota bacterium]|nr:C40 family peptidase [Bacteroidota bacterium]